VFVLVEHPLPWPRDISEDPLLAEVTSAAQASAGSRRVRVQAVLCDSSAGARRIVVFSAGSPPFAGYGRAEGIGAPEDLPALAGALVAAPTPAPVRGVTDVLVCTHGSRDACCGSLGTRLFIASNPNVRLWRTSHTGGHRFAPTAITFPDGVYWAFLDPVVLDGIVSRTLPAETAASHVRGCAAFPPEVQVADRAALVANGWDWLDYARFGEIPAEGRVQLCWESPLGLRGGYDVRIAPGRHMPVPDCGGDPAAASKSEHEWQVTRLRAWT
jgi:hypothetical protein